MTSSQPCGERLDLCLLGPRVGGKYRKWPVSYTLGSGPIPLMIFFSVHNRVRVRGPSYVQR